VAENFDNGNEPSGSIKVGEFLAQTRKYQLLKEDSAAWRYLAT
jgi:phage portal protein BeeE